MIRNWISKKFNELTVDELYQILQLRSEVFVVEQNCPYLDCDDKDQKSQHFWTCDNEKIISYVRILPPGVSYEEMSIGRVCTSPSVRRSGAGKELMEAAINECYRLHGQGPIRIGAQLYLKKFYESFDFISDGNVYLEDDIEHTIMLKA